MDSQTSLDSPTRQAVPQFGAWRSNSDPNSPVADYSQAFARARASRLGAIPPNEEKDDYQPQPDERTNITESRRPAVRQSYRRNFCHFFVCGSRAQTVN